MKKWLWPRYSNHFLKDVILNIKAINLKLIYIMLRRSSKMVTQGATIELPVGNTTLQPEAQPNRNGAHE